MSANPYTHADAKLESDLRRSIVHVSDFPKPGVGFKDITPVLADAALFARVTAALAAPFAANRVTHVLAVESRGFLFGAPVAQALRAGLVPIRKPGKLPRQTVAEQYSLEYGTDALELHHDAIRPGDHVLIVDDVLATGGTAAAAVRLVERLRAQLEGIAVVVDLSFLPWRTQLVGRRVHSLIAFEG